jgi:O-antigen polymerase
MFSRKNITAERVATICIAFIFILGMNYNAVSQGGAGLQLPFNISTWLLAIVFIIIALLRIVLFSHFILSRYTLYYAGFIILLFSPLLYSDTTYIAKEYITLLGVIGAFLFFVALTQFKTERLKNNILLILFISSLIQSIWAFIQYYFIFEPSFWFYGANSGVPHGIFLQKNVFATYISMGSLLSIYFLFCRPVYCKLALAGVFFVVILNAHLSMLIEAKTGRVVPIIALIVYLVFIMKLKRTFVLPLILCVVSLLVSFTPKQWFDVRPDSDLVDVPVLIESFGRRPVMYGLSLDLIQQKFFTGHGIGNLHKPYSVLQGKYIKANPTYEPSENIGHVHNEILQWMIQLGVVAGFAFLALFCLWVYGFKFHQLDPKILLLGLPFIGHSMLEYPFYHSAPHLLAFVTILAISIRSKGKKIPLTYNVKGTLVIVFTIFAYKSIAFLLGSLISLNAMIQYKVVLKENSLDPLIQIEPTGSYKMNFEHEIYQYKLRQAIENGEMPKDLLDSFIKWSEAKIAHAPFKLLYIQLTQSYILKKDIDNASRVITEAHDIFPTDEGITIYYNKLHPQ